MIREGHRVLDFCGLTPEAVRRFYDRFGAFQDLQAIYEDQALKILVKHSGFQSAQSVFEFGCGTGRLARRLFDYELGTSCRYHAVEISRTMVERSRRRLGQWNSRVQVEHADGTIRLNPLDSSVDRFLATYVFDLLSPRDIEKVLDQAHRILSENGRLSLVSLTEGATPMSRFLTALWKQVWIRKPSWMGGCRPVSLLQYLDKSKWVVEFHDRQVAMGLLTSELVVAIPIMKTGTVFHST